MPTKDQSGLLRSVRIRWMIRRDIAEVIHIEKECFDNPWSKSDILDVLRDRNCIGLVAESRERIVGHVFYELFPDSISILRMAVHLDFQEQGIGRLLTENLSSKLSPRHRQYIWTFVSEEDLGVQLFLKACGFLAAGMCHEEYEAGDEDGIVFEYSHPDRVISEEDRQWLKDAEGPGIKIKTRPLQQKR